MLLDHGTYTFVCINDAVTDNGTSLEVKHDAVNAMIGTTTVAITQPRQEISFTMRHMMARIRYQITSYTTAPTNATFSMGTDAGPFGTETFNIKGEKISQAYKSYSFLNIPLTPTAAVQNSAIVKKYKSLTNYMYFPDGFDTGIIQSGGVKGNLHGKTFSISPTSWFLNRTSVQRNHSYVFNFTIKSKTPLLLFQDGTVGYLGDKGTRTPIGVVAREKTATQHGIAVALKDVDNLTYAYTTPYDWDKMNIQHNTTHYTDFEDVANDLAGYDWTYEASGSVDGRIKANFSADYTPFYKVARYNPGIGITGSNVGKWYLPAMGEWYLAFKFFGRWDGVISSSLNLDLAAMNKAFTDAGGDALKHYQYWNSSEFAGAMRPLFYVGPTIMFSQNATHNLVCHIRPFVHF